MRTYYEIKIWNPDQTTWGTHETEKLENVETIVGNCSGIDLTIRTITDGIQTGVVTITHTTKQTISIFMCGDPLRINWNRIIVPW